jgi:aspartate ammonia-lyase
MSRLEKDSLGEVKVPEEAYYGSFTARAKDNFDLSGTRPSRELIKSLGEIKVAAARANRELRNLDEARAEAIVSAGEEVISGDFDDQFPLDLIQAGAGTPLHMNANEVIANRATELVGGEKGEYLVHPNDHVNLGQSSNNVVPTALRLALIRRSKILLSDLENMVDALREKASEFEGVVKVGRTHYQDAVPITLGQEFGAYAVQIGRTSEGIEEKIDGLREVGLGGNAVGTGINTPPEFRNLVVRELSRVTGEGLKPADNSIALTQTMEPFLALSGSIRVAARELIKITDDLMFLSSGPGAGINEIELPEVEPGSSIMPGKVNPSILEAVKMAFLQVLGYDHTVSLAAGEGHLELNVMTPVIGKNLMAELKMLAKAVKSMRRDCVEGIRANREEISRQFDESTAVATALSPYLGYDRVAEIVKLSLKEGRDLKQLVRERGWLTEEELEQLLDPERLTSPQGIDEELKERVEERFEEDE